MANTPRIKDAQVSHMESILLTALQEYWGYDSFRPLQQESMLSAMEGRDSLTVLPTGGGKSLCYQAPAVCRDGMAIVVSPLIALMKDQVDALTECGIPAAFINSTLTPDERQAVASRIRNGELKMLFAAPERLVQQRTLDFLANIETNISFIAIDEAHCISKWGHDFRPEYRQMGTLRKTFPNASIHAFTATATEMHLSRLHRPESRGRNTFVIHPYLQALLNIVQATQQTTATRRGSADGKGVYNARTIPIDVEIYGYRL